MNDDLSDYIEAKRIPLRLVVDGTTPADQERKDWARDSVMQLALGHMVAGLRVANRLRAERGQPAMTREEVLALLELV